MAGGRRLGQGRDGRCCGVDLWAALGETGERETGGIAGAVFDGGGIEIDGGGGEARGVLAGTDGVAEGERIAAGAARKGGDAAIVESKRGGAAGDRDGFIEIEGEGDGVAGVEVAGGGRLGQGRDGRCCGVDLRAALGETGERETGGIAGAVFDGGGIEIDGGGGEARGVLAGTDGVAEGERIAAGAARKGGDAAIVESKRGGAAGDRDGFIEIEGEGDGVAGIEVAGGRRLGQGRDGRCCGVDLRAALGETGERETGGIAGAVFDGGGIEIDGGGGEARGVLAGTDGVAEGERIAAGAARKGGDAAIVESKRGGAAGDRDGFIEIEGEGDGVAGIEVAGGGRLGQGRDGRCCGVDLWAALGETGERETGGIAGAVFDGGGIEIDGGGGEARGVLAGTDGVAEGERIAAGAARKGGDAAIVESKRGGAAGDRDGFIEIEGEGDGVAGIEVAGGRRLGQGRDGRCCGVDLRAALGETGERETGGIAGAVFDGGGIEIDGGGGEARGVLAGTDGVAEGERIAAGAARKGGDAAIVESKRGGAAGDRDGFIEIEGEGDGVAGIEVASGRRLGQGRDGRCCGVDLWAALGETGERETGGIAGAVFDGGGIEIDGGGGEARGVLAGTDGVAEGERIAAGAARKGGDAAIVESKRGGAAGDRDGFIEIEGEGDGVAGIEVAGGGRLGQGRDGRCCGVDLWAALGETGERETGGIAGAVFDGGGIEIDGGGGEARGVLAGTDGVAEGERIAAGAARKGGDAAIVESKRGGAAGDRDGFIEIEGEGDGVAGIEVAGGGRLGQGRDGRCCGVDLRAALGETGERETGGIAGAVFDGGGIEIDGGGGEARGVLAGTDGVAEGERIAAGAARKGGDAAIVESKRGGAAGDRDGFIEIEGEGDGVAGVEVAGGGRLGQGRDGRCCGVDLRAALGETGERETGGIAGAVFDGGGIEIDGGGGEARGVLAGTDGVAEGKRIAAGAARKGGDAAIVESKRGGAAGDRDGFIEIEGEGDGVAGIEVAGGGRLGQGRDGRCCGVDLRAALGETGERETGGIAGAVFDGGGIEIDGGGGEARGVLAGTDGVAEGERIAAGAARKGGDAAIVESKRGGAAGDRDGFIEIEGEGDGVAGIEVASGRRLDQGRDGRCCGVDLWAALGETGERETGGIAGAVFDGGGIEIDGGGGEARGVLAGTDGVAEGERIAAGAARKGGDAAIVESKRGGAAGDRDGFIEIEGEGDGVAGVEVAGGRRLGQGRDGRYCGVDLRAALGETGERETGGIAGAVFDGGGIEIDGGGGEARGVLAGTDGVAEGKRIAAGAARKGGDAAIVESKRGGAAGDRDGFIEIEGEGDGVAGIEVASGR